MNMLSEQSNMEKNMNKQSFDTIYYLQIHRDIIARKRQAHQDKIFLSESGQRLVLVVRIRGINGVPPKPKKIMELLRLRQVVLLLRL